VNKKKASNQTPVPGAGPNIYRMGVIPGKIAVEKYRVCWTDERGKRREKTYAIDTPIDKMIAFRKRMESNVADAGTVAGTTDGGFGRDVVRFLKTRKGMPSYASDRSHLKPWVNLFRRGSRHAITHERIAVAVADWRGHYSPREIKHRVGLLKKLFHCLDHDGRKGPTPCDFVTLPKIPITAPKGVADSIIAAVAKKLVIQEQCGRLRDAKTRARFLVRATTGKRPCQIDRTVPTDVDFTTRVWDVPHAKHAPGGKMWLNDEMVAAWTLFRDADAWGPKYDKGSFAKTLRRNGWPGGKGGTRPYNMRHQTLQTMDEMDIDPRAIQQAGNHTSFNTTDRFYLGKSKLAKSKFAAEVIDGRFDSDVFTARAPKDYDTKGKKTA